MDKKIILVLCIFPLLLIGMEAPPPPQVKNIWELIKRSPAIIAERTKGDYLDLSGLQITSLEGLGDIFDIQNITELNLSDNLLTKISNDSFTLLPNLRVLILSDNQIETIETLAFTHLSKLQELNLDHNKLKKISIELNRLFFLTKLTLANNKIEKIASNAFRDLWRLEIVDLSNNQLVSLPDDLFHPLKALDIYKTNYAGMNLTFLDLSNNGIAHLPLDFFTYLKKLEMLDISGNPFKPKPQYKNAILKKIAEGALIDE